MEIFKYIRTLYTYEPYCQLENVTSSRNKTINWRIERTEADRSNSNKAQTMSTLELVDATPAHPLIAIH